MNQKFIKFLIVHSALLAAVNGVVNSVVSSVVGI